MRNIIRIGAGTDGRNRFVAIALGVALAVGPAVALPAAALAAPATDAAAASTTAGATITLQGADGASLAGHTFDMYRIGTYTDQILNGTRISSLGVRGDTASNAWAADAIGIANAYDPSTADDIGKVYGYDDAGNIANIKMDSQTRQLRNISKALAQSSRRPAAIQGGANLTTTQSTLTINVPAEGLYYITDSAGNPIMVGTKSGNANIMQLDAKDPQWRTLGVAVVKAKSVRVDKKVQVQRNGTTVGKDGTASDPVGVTVGDTVTNTVEVTVPNKQAASAVKFKLIDHSHRTKRVLPAFDPKQGRGGQNRIPTYRSKTVASFVTIRKKSVNCVKGSGYERCGPCATPRRRAATPIPATKQHHHVPSGESHEPATNHHQWNNTREKTHHHKPRIPSRLRVGHVTGILAGIANALRY